LLLPAWGPVLGQAPREQRGLELEQPLLQEQVAQLVARPLELVRVPELE
jgi:hypothetical protein